MNKGLLLSFWDTAVDFVTSWFDVIPKIIYFLFTAFSSGIDAMQALIRKLAGLDTYYSAKTDEVFSQKDPLTEFIYGILGVGNSSTAYKALNTVFWSLTIFGLIMLVVSTMVALIKSHYSEDSAGTNPWKYIYTAIKAVLTYAIIPFVMILGLQLSSFILRTLDNVTGSNSNVEQIKTIYGSNASEIFEGEYLTGSDEKSYIYYDYFSFGDATSNTPFGSLLFKASAMNCNRVRTGKAPYTAYQQLESNGKVIFGDQSNCQEFASLTSDNEKAEYVAYQIDYAFCNNLHLSSSISLSQLESITDKYVTYSTATDPVGWGNNHYESFSKYNVTLVWFFYDLWKFNFIVAFGGGITIFSLLLSIIMGLMTRLVKGAALFLIYPSLLGLAPLDNFKAFKSWGTTLLQQILMAFGAIVGMNILLLLLPFLQNISFFNQGHLDAIISMILLIVGLIMTKDFISMIAGFAAGADANSAGAGIKDEVGKTVLKGASITGKVGLGVGRAATAAGVGAVTTIGLGAFEGGKAIGKSIRRGTQAHKINKYKEGAYDNKSEGPGLQRTIEETMKKAKGEKTSYTDVNAPAMKAAEEAMAAAKEAGKSDDMVDAAGRNAIKNSLRNQTTKDGVNKYDKLKDLDEKRYEKMLKNGNEGQKKMVKNAKKYNRAQELLEELDESSLRINKKGKYAAALDKDAFSMTSKNASLAGLTIGDGMLKAFNGAGDLIGVDKAIKKLKEFAQEGLTFKGGVFEGSAYQVIHGKKKEDKLEGDKLQSKIAEKQHEDSERQTQYLKIVADNISKLQQAQATGNELQGKILKEVKKSPQNSAPTPKTSSDDSKK